MGMKKSHYVTSLHIPTPHACRILEIFLESPYPNLVKILLKYRSIENLKKFS